MTTRAQILSPHTDPTPRQARFEDERVGLTLAAFGLDEVKWEMFDDHDRETSTRRLTFAAFRRRFPNFPVLLAARYEGGVGMRARPADLLRRFHRTFVCDRYLEAYARHTAEAGGRPVGLVLPFDGVRSGVVLHDGVFDTGGTRLVHTFPFAGPPYRVTAEPFDRLLAHLTRSGWSPGRAGPGPPPVAPGKGEWSAPLAPWIAERLGTGPGFVVYVWLAALLAAGDPATVRRGRGGVRYLAVTQDDLAGRTGLSPAAVKRGLAVLRRQGLIDTGRRDGGTILVLNPPSAEGEG